MTTQPLNLPRIRSRLIKTLGNESQSINKILCHIVNDNGHTIFRAFRVLGKRPPMHRLGIKYDKNPLSKPVVQYSLIGEKIKEWASASEVESQLSINDGQISACCLHRKGHYTAGGFIWEFRDKN